MIMVLGWLGVSLALSFAMGLAQWQVNRPGIWRHILAVFAMLSVVRFTERLHLGFLAELVVGVGVGLAGYSAGWAVTEQIKRRKTQGSRDRERPSDAR